MIKLVIIAVLMLLGAYALAAVTPYVVPFLKHLAARYGFAAREPEDGSEHAEVCPHGEPMTDTAEAACPLCTPQRALAAETSAVDAVPTTVDAPEPANASPADRVLIESAPWLMARWAEAERDRGDGSRVPSWHFDAPTEPQLQQLRDAGLTLRLTGLTRGQATDILGLFQPAAAEDKEILRFFDVPLADMNRSRARHEVAQLLADPKNLQAWSERPADILQKEFFRCFGLQMPRGLTALEAEELIRDHRVTVEEEDASLLDDWDAFESMCVELLDPDAGAVYGIRTPRLTAIRSAVDALRKEGHSLSKLAEDRRLVVDKLVQSDPELRIQRD